MTRPGGSAVAALVVALAAATACRRSAEDRARAAAARARSEAPVRTSEVVQMLRSPEGPGSIVYDAPTDLSDTTLRRTRPDLVPPESARGNASPPQGRRSPRER